MAAVTDEKSRLQLRGGIDMSGSKVQTYRQDVLTFASEQYGTEPEFLWASYPDYAVQKKKQWLILR